MRHEITLQSGHTLVELLASLAIAAILAGVAVPTFGGWLLDLRRDSSVNTSLHAVHIARQLAATRGENVSLCGRRDQMSCSGLTDWSRGLLVASPDGQAVRELPVGTSVRLRSNRPEIRFEAGTGNATPATLTICDRRGPGFARAVIISRSGRPRASAPGDGVPAC